MLHALVAARPSGVRPWHRGRSRPEPQVLPLLPPFLPPLRRSTRSYPSGDRLQLQLLTPGQVPIDQAVVVDALSFFLRRRDASCFAFVIGVVFSACEHLPLLKASKKFCASRPEKGGFFHSFCGLSSPPPAPGKLLCPRIRVRGEGQVRFCRGGCCRQSRFWPNPTSAVPLPRGGGCCWPWWLAPFKRFVPKKPKGEQNGQKWCSGLF